MHLHRVLLTIAVLCAVAAGVIEAVRVDKISSNRRQHLAELTQHKAGRDAAKEKVMTRAATIPSAHNKKSDNTIAATLVPRQGERVIDRQTVMSDKKYLAAELIDDYPQRFSKFTTLLEMRNVPGTFRMSPKLLEMHARAAAAGYDEDEEDDPSPRRLSRREEAEDQDAAGGDDDDQDMRFRDEDAKPAAAAAPAAGAAPSAAGAAPAGHGDKKGAPYVSQGFYSPPPPPPPLPVDLPPPPYIPPLMETSMPVAEAKAIAATADDAEVVTNIK